MREYPCPECGGAKLTSYQRSEYVQSNLVSEDSNLTLTADYTVPAMEADLLEARRTFETNFFSVIHMCKTFLPLLIKAKGTIVQVGSVAGVSIIPMVLSSPS